MLESQEYGFIKCGIVLGQECVYKEISFNDQINKKDLGTYPCICIILDHLRLNALMLRCRR